MNTSRTTTLSKPTGEERIPIASLGYMRARNKHRLYTLVIREFKKSRISQTTLARRLGKGTDVVCRLLAAPGNWQLDTISDLLFAISGTEVAYDVSYPLDKPSRNYVGEPWIIDGNPSSATNGKNFSILKVA